MKEHLSFSAWCRYQECEVKALAFDKGDYTMEPTQAMKVSSLADVLLTGTEEELEKFKENNHDMYGKTGNLKADFQRVNNAVGIAKQDKEFMKYMEGAHQVELVGEIGGIKVIGYVDVLHEDRIVDLKTVKDFKKEWDPVHRTWVTWVQHRNYEVQGAIYRELYYQNTGIYLPFYIAAMSKEEHSARIIVDFPDECLDEALVRFTESVERIAQIRQGIIEPNRCKKCDYCKDNYEAYHIDYRLTGLE